MGLDNPIHIAFLLILLLLVFGAKRLPEMGRSLGDGMRGFKDAIGGESPPTAHPMTQPAALVAQPQTQEAVAPVQQGPIQQIPVQQVPAPVQVVPTPQPVMEKLPA
jgi:sec-independent protein translocase protein TatA